VKNHDVGCGGYASTNCIVYELKKISRVLSHELIDNIQTISPIQTKEKLQDLLVIK
jgi:hypothetical protein